MASVAQALAAVRARAVAAGHNPTDQQVLDTYNRDLARGNSVAYITQGSAGLPAGVLSAGHAAAASAIGGPSTPLQLTGPSGTGPAATGDSTQNVGPSLGAGLGSIPPNVLLLGGAAIVVLLVLRKK